MRFGKPTLTEEEPAPTEQVVYWTVSAEVRAQTWTWTFKGVDANEHAKGLLGKLTGEADEHGWIRDDDGDWAYQAIEIRGVYMMRKTEKVSTAKDAA